ncbi:MAG: hypothetical protein AB7N65_23680 [Vicinamibacterales bacterium]
MSARLDRVAWHGTLWGVLGIAILIPFWMRMIVSPAPQEMREGALLWSTRAILQHQNPYGVETLPGPANVYGPLYPLVVAPLAAFTGPTLLAHRLVNGLAILAACALVFAALRREGVSRLTALAGAMINLAGLLYWVGPTARPDGVGMVLLVGAYVVLAPDPASSGRRAVALLLAIAGFATKIYYVLPAGVMVAWFVIHRGPRGSLRTALAASGAVSGAALTLLWLCPAWAPIVLGANLRASTYDPWHLLLQSRDWAIFSLPLLVALATAWRPWRQPLDLWTVALACGVATMLFALGGHRGAHMTYFFHLVTPPLTIIALRHADRTTLSRLAFAASLPLAIWLNAHWFTLDVARMARAERTFDRLARAIDDARTPTGTSEFAPLLMAAGVEPVETGHTEYFHISRPPGILVPFWGELSRLQAGERRFTRRVYAALYSGAYDLVIANRRRLDVLTPDALSNRYQTVERVELDLPWAQQSWPVEVWIPRPARH